MKAPFNRIIAVLLTFLLILVSVLFINLPPAKAALTGAMGCEHSPRTIGRKQYYECMVEAKPCLNARNVTTFTVDVCLPNGTVIYVAQQIRLKDHSIYGSNIWDVLKNGDIVSDYYVNTSQYGAFSLPIPNDSTATPTITATDTQTIAPTATVTDTPTATSTATDTSTPTAIPGPVGQNGNWKLLFHDEFTGKSLDARWATCYFNFHISGTNNDCYHDQSELEAYTPQNVTVSNGILTLTAQKQTVASYKYTSGMISSGPASDGAKSGFPFTYGYAEMRVKIPTGQGLWPAFWLLPADESYPPEIDVFEILGNAPNVVNMHYHYPDGSSEGSDSGGEWTGPDFSAGWHTFAIDWEPGSLTWYVDGIARRHYSSSNVSSTPMYLIANLAVGGDWPGAPDATTSFPASMQIDYIRVWQH